MPEIGRECPEPKRAASREAGRNAHPVELVRSTSGLLRTAPSVCGALSASAAESIGSAKPCIGSAKSRLGKCDRVSADCAPPIELAKWPVGDCALPLPDCGAPHQECDRSIRINQPTVDVYQASLERREGSLHDCALSFRRRRCLVGAPGGTFVPRGPRLRGWSMVGRFFLRSLPGRKGGKNLVKAATAKKTPPRQETLSPWLPDNCRERRPSWATA